MNKVILIGRLASDPEVKYMQNENQTAVARYRLAVNRRIRKEGEQDADFISCVAFGKNGEFAEKWLTKGMKIAVVGRITTGSYEKDDGSKVYTTDVIVEEHEFCEGKSSNGSEAASSSTSSTAGFTPVQNTDDDLPF